MNTAEQNNKIQETLRQESKSLLGFIKRRVPSLYDAEDILQDVYYELVESYRLTKPIDQLVGWLYMVAKNKINDLYRGKKLESLNDLPVYSEGDETYSFLEQLADSSSPEPLMQELILDALSASLRELPADQRLVFELNELEQKSFKEISEITGVKVNTLLSKKHQAVLYLRERLRFFYDEILNN